MKDYIEPQYPSPIFFAAREGVASRLSSVAFPLKRFSVVLFFCLCASLVAAHMLVIAFVPPRADGFIYAIWAASILTYAVIAFVQARSVVGMLSLRWGLFAFYLFALCLIYVQSSVAEFIPFASTQVTAVLSSIGTASVLLAITLSSGDRSRRLDPLDVAVALVLCGLRFLYHLGFGSSSTPTSSTLAHYTFDPLLTFLLSCIAFAASPWEKKKFYRNVTLFLAANMFASLCVNQIGYLWFHQLQASPWTLTATLVPLASAIYLLASLTNAHTQSRIQVRESRRPVVHALLPFAITILILPLSVILWSSSPRVARFGLAFAAVAFFARIALMARQQDRTEQALRNALRNENWQDGPDPLDKVQNERSFGPALWQARATAHRDNPLSLLLFRVEEVADGVVLVQPELEGGALIHVARQLCQWRPRHSTLYYLGDSAFAMLLPAAGQRRSRELASQITTSIEALYLTGSSGFVRLSVGTATALAPAEVDRLFNTANYELPRSQRLHGEVSSRFSQTAATG